MLISDIISEIISDVGGDAEDTNLVATILNFFKGALRRFPLYARNRTLITTNTVTLSSGSNYVALPSGFLNEIIVYRISGGARIEIEKPPHFSRLVNTQGSGVPLYYEIRGANIYFDKNADTNYTIYIEHYKEIDAISSSDTWAHDSSMAEVAKDGTKMKYYSDYVEDRAKSQDNGALFKSGLEEIETKFMMKECGTHVEES